jgi:hypothetical protein
MPAAHPLQCFNGRIVEFRGITLWHGLSRRQSFDEPVQISATPAHHGHSKVNGL